MDVSAPKKKNLTPHPPQKNSPDRRRHPPGHSAPPPLDNPPWGFSIKPEPPPPWSSSSPFPPPRAEKKIKNIRNVHQEGLIPVTNHANDHYSLSSVHSEWLTNRSNHIHAFTPITRIVATKRWNCTLETETGTGSVAFANYSKRNCFCQRNCPTRKPKQLSIPSPHRNRTEPGPP